MEQGIEKLNTENLVGVSGANTTDILGNVVWYSVSKILITPSELEKKLVDSGVGKEWMPNSIRIVDAFRRATKLKKRVKSDTPNEFFNYMVREVYSDKEVAIRHLVIETVDQDGKRLDYNQEAGRMIIDKKTAVLTVESEQDNAMAKAFVEEMAANFEVFKHHYDSQAIRVMIADILKSMAPVPLRNNGGIYFVPRSFEEHVNKFTKLCSSLSVASNGWKLPVVDTFEQRQMVSHSLRVHIKELSDECNASIGQGVAKAKIKELIDRIGKIEKDFKEYATLVEQHDADIISKEIMKLKGMVTQLLLEIKN